MHALHMGALPALGGVLALEDTPAAQSSAAWAIGTLCENQPASQEAVRRDEAGYRELLPRIIALANPSTVACSQAVTALYSICLHNVENKTRVAELGAIEALVALLRDGGDAKKASRTEKVLAALVALILKHPSNARRAAGCRRVAQYVATCLASPAGRVSALACGVVRIGTVEVPALSVQLVALGALGYTSSLCASTDDFVQVRLARMCAGAGVGCWLVCCVW